MKRHLKPLLSGLIAGGILAVTLGVQQTPVEAADAAYEEQLLQQQSDNAAALASLNEEIAAYQAQNNSISARLEELKQQQLASEAEYESFMQELEVARTALADALSAYQAAVEEVNAKQAEYEDRIVALFPYRQTSTLQILLESDGLSGFFTNMRLMEYIASEDNEALEALQAAAETAELSRQNAQDAATEAQAYYEHAETMLEQINNNVAVTQTDLESVEGALLNRSSAYDDVLTEQSNVQASLDTYYAQVASEQEESIRQSSLAQAAAEAAEAAQSQSAALAAQEAEAAAAAAAAASQQEAQQAQEGQTAQAVQETAAATAAAASDVAETTAAATQAAPTAAPASAVVSGSESMITPIASGYTITSQYGSRVHPITGAVESFHYGTDFAAAFGTPIRAVLSGTVITASMPYPNQNYTSSKSGYGNYVVIQHANGMTTTYAHMKYVAVSAGQLVSQGDYLGDVGSTGASTGAHCHLEVSINGSTVNPMNYIN
ncbi:MAG: peptidoglycan DD-metalloendopeptidase family protein [Oscillospiraceae bacterium]|nr:peptidoglycan DD-metalloendopeptidase family protein [Oscillospiraceae bacterium]